MLLGMNLNTEKIKKEIKRNDWTIYEFAEKLGMSFQSIYWIFSHKSTRLSTINKMAKVLELDPKDLLI